MKNVDCRMQNGLKNLLFFAIAVMTTASAMAAGISGSLYSAGVTKYLWRGQVLSDGYAIQPGLTINSGKFSYGYWGSFHAYGSDAMYNESDYTISFADTAPYIDVLGLKAGFTVYTFPYSGNGLRSSVEVFAGITSSVVSSPYLTFYYDTMLGNGGYLEAGLSHSIPLGDFKVSGSATCGYNFGQWVDPSFSVLGLTLSGGYAIAGFTITPSVFYQVALDLTYSSLFSASLGLNYDFTL